MRDIRTFNLQELQRAMTVIVCAAVMCILTSGSGHAQQIEKTTFPVQWNNEELQFPFAGGMEAPQFSQIDFNRDGLQDVFVFDRVGNTITPFVSKFREGVFSYELGWDLITQFPTMENWALTLDFNQDGIEDIFTSSQIPGVQSIEVYRGREEGSTLRFEKMLFDFADGFDALHFKLGNDYTSLYAAWIDIPAITDIDGDGDVDILSFEPGGSAMHYFKNVVVEEGLSIDTFKLLWEDVCWGKFFENAFSEAVELSDDPNTCAQTINPMIIQSRHSGSACFAFDADNDGDMDLLLGDLASARVKLLFNGGTAQKAWMTSLDNTFPSYDVPTNIPTFVAPFVLDINWDGLPDVVNASNNAAFSENRDVAWFYRNDPVGPNETEFRLETTGLFVSQMLDFGSEARPAFFDYNGDGLMDILVGTGGYYSPQSVHDARLILLKNIGSASEPQFRVVDEDYLGFSAFAGPPTFTYGFAPAIGDLDQDGDMDLLVGELNGGLYFLKNTAGAGHLAQFETPVYPYAGINVGVSSTPAMIDLNGDGLMDIVCGERTGNNENSMRCGNLNYYQNQGSPGNPQFNPDLSADPNSQCLGRLIFSTNAAVPEYSAPAFVHTADGLRLVCGSELGKVFVYGDISPDDASPFSPVDLDYARVRDGSRVCPSLADIDGDEYFEMVCGNKRGGLTIYHTDLRKSTTAVHNASSKEIQILLSPNPASGSVQLICKGGACQQASVVQIYSPEGRKLRSFINWAPGETRSLELPAGVYFASIQMGDVLRMQKLLII